MKCVQNACEDNERFTNNGGIFERFDLACRNHYLLPVILHPPDN